MVVKACRIALELHILEEALLEAKIKKLAVVFHDANVEVARVQF